LKRLDELIGWLQ